MAGLKLNRIDPAVTLIFIETKQEIENVLSPAPDKFGVGAFYQ